MTKKQETIILKKLKKGEYKLRLNEMRIVLCYELILNKLILTLIFKIYIKTNTGLKLYINCVEEHS